MTYRGPVSRAVASAIGSATIRPEDAGAVALARRYAALIDEASPKSAYAEPLRKIADALMVLDADGETAKALTKVTEALAQHSVASDLGPKLLAALTALGLTPAGRGAKGGVGNAAEPAVEPVDPLDELRKRRQRRPAG